MDIQQLTQVRHLVADTGARWKSVHEKRFGPLTSSISTPIEPVQPLQLVIPPAFQAEVQKYQLSSYARNALSHALDNMLGDYAQQFADTNNKLAETTGPQLQPLLPKVAEKFRIIEYAEKRPAPQLTPTPAPACRPYEPYKPFNNVRVHPILQTYFQYDAFPSASDRQIIAERSGMTKRQIEVWFQNHRRIARQRGLQLKKRPVGAFVPANVHIPFLSSPSSSPSPDPNPNSTTTEPEPDSETEREKEKQRMLDMFNIHVPASSFASSASTPTKATAGSGTGYTPADPIQIDSSDETDSGSMLITYTPGEAVGVLQHVDDVDRMARNAAIVAPRYPPSGKTPLSSTFPAAFTLPPLEMQFRKLVGTRIRLVVIDSGSVSRLHHPPLTFRLLLLLLVPPTLKGVGRTRQVRSRRRHRRCDVCLYVCLAEGTVLGLREGVHACDYGAGRGNGVQDERKLEETETGCVGTEEEAKECSCCVCCSCSIDIDINIFSKNARGHSKAKLVTRTPTPMQSTPNTLQRHGSNSSLSSSSSSETGTDSRPRTPVDGMDIPSMPSNTTRKAAFPLAGFTTAYGVNVDMSTPVSVPVKQTQIPAPRPSVAAPVPAAPTSTSVQPSAIAVAAHASSQPQPQMQMHLQHIPAPMAVPDYAFGNPYSVAVANVPTYNSSSNGAGFSADGCRGYEYERECERCMDELNVLMGFTVPSGNGNGNVRSAGHGYNYPQVHPHPQAQQGQQFNAYGVNPIPNSYNMMSMMGMGGGYPSHGLYGGGGMNV
ncbi:hypothetical protein BT96DRAFT_919434 [Gymnopus androsaceus JB14]|uniref:Homeobox domain-containing protein n=1 Tax=Gymnopus androsaceus JB14 TaxID=1447944 RepID=A0A6A4HTG5_9AGAR|nr:hypothetical protein BT96DRAFT_919434 [Gymnopus androsaceus JB14]